VQIEHAFQGADKTKSLNFSVDKLDRTDKNGAFSYRSFFYIKEQHFAYQSG
jgi:hypothetical protein